MAGRRVSSDAAAAAAEAARKASEAGRILQAQRQERAQPEPKPELKPQPTLEPRPSREEAPTTDEQSQRIAELRKNNPSDKLREELYEAQAKRYANPELPTEETAKEPEAPAPEPEKPAEAVAEVAQPEAPAQPEATKFIRVKVDGEEFDVDAKEVDAEGGVGAYQRKKAEENRIKRFNEAIGELKRLQAEMVKQPAQPTQPSAQQQDDKAFIASKLDIIRFGTPDEAAAALLEIQQRNAPKAPDAQAIITHAVAVIENKNAVERFKQEFPEIVSNPLLLRLAHSLDMERRANLTGPVDWNDYYRRIGNEIRSVVPAKPSQPAATAPATTSTPSQPSEKEARKASSASITNLPAASARAELPKEEKEPSRQDILDEMKKSRMVWRG